MIFSKVAQYDARSLKKIGYKGVGADWSNLDMSALSGTQDTERNNKNRLRNRKLSLIVFSK